MCHFREYLKNIVAGRLKTYHKAREAAPAKCWPVCRAEMALQLLRSQRQMNTLKHLDFCESKQQVKPQKSKTITIYQKLIFVDQLTLDSNLRVVGYISVLAKFRVSIPMATANLPIITIAFFSRT